jgi:hypothetical protein
VVGPRSIRANWGVAVWAKALEHKASAKSSAPRVERHIRGDSLAVRLVASHLLKPDQHQASLLKDIDPSCLLIA